MGQNFVLQTAIVAVVGSIVFTNYLRKSSEVAQFFFEELRGAKISENVIVAGKSYDVVHGVVSPADGYAGKALETAYSKALARRAPILGIAGVTPEKMIGSVASLRLVQNQLSDLQSAANEALLVRTSLYPTSFLNALALTEKKRLDFLSSGSDTDDALYRESLIYTARTGRKDSLSFKYALNKIIGTDTFKFYGMNGTISNDSLIRSAQGVSLRFDDVLQDLYRRDFCLGGTISACTRDELILPAITSFGENYVPKARIMSPQQLNIAGLLADAASGTGVGKRKIIELGSSVCINDANERLFAVREESDDYLSPFLFLGDPIFYSAEKTRNQLVLYLKEKYDVTFFKINPMSFYNCPDVLKDMSMLRAVQATVNFALDHPFLFKSANVNIEDSVDIYQERDARAYIDAALTKLENQGYSLPRSQSNQIISLYVMFKEQSAGIDDLISNISAINVIDIKHREDNVPFDLSAKTLFLVRSAFPSLFSSQNPSSGHTKVMLKEHDPVGVREFLSTVTEYKNLAGTVSREKIVRDLNLYNLFEHRYNSALQVRCKNLYDGPCQNRSSTNLSVTGVFHRASKILDRVRKGLFGNAIEQIIGTGTIEKKCGKDFRPKYECQREVVVDVVTKNGLEAGFRAVKELYEKKPRFRPFCHKFAMDVGAELYKKFPDYTKLSYTPLSVTCNYGFYQEYPHSLLLATGDIKKAKEFCEFIGKKLATEVPGAESECFRGIGRGLPFITKPRIGDISEMANFATGTCKNISPNLEDYKTCLSGAFNQLGREQAAGKYNLFVQQSDPLSLCRQQLKDVQPQCYGNFKWVAVPKVEQGDDISPALKAAVNRSTDDAGATARAIVWTIAYEEGRKSVGENIIDHGIIPSCATLSSPFQADCISGFAVGLAKHGFPWRQHEAVLDFCQIARLSAPLKDTDCASQAINYLRDFYSPEQTKKMCLDLKRKLGVTCK